MKWLAALGFLAATFGSIWLDNRNLKTAILRFQTAKVATLLPFLVGTASLLLKFIAFACLTGLFPTYLVLMLIGASLVSATLLSLAGAVAGFTLPQVREKIGALSAIWATQNKVAGCAMMLVGLLIMGGQIVGALWVYATHVRGDAEAVGWIALFLFILPRLVLVPVQMGMFWPVVTSPFIDNDMRNQHLASQFVAMLNSTIILVYPFVLLREQMVAVLGTVPALWILLSIPVLIFLLLGIIPFFVGTHRFRTQSRALLSWRRDWLNDLLLVMQLPNGQLRSETLNDRLAILREEISRRFRENTLLTVYQEHFPGEVAFAERAADQLALTGSVTPAVLSAARTVLAEQKDPEPDQNPDPDPQSDSKQLEQVRESLKYLGGQSYTHLRRSIAPSQDLMGAMKNILLTYRHRLVEWDLSFHEIRQLLDLYRTSLEARTQDLTVFVKSQLEILKDQELRLKGASRWTLGSIATVGSGMVVAVFKAFQDDIVKGLFSLMGM